MYRKLVASFILLLFVVAAIPVKAQFEGKIMFNTYKVQADGSRQQDDQFTMYITNDRILLEGTNKYDVIGSIKTEGILIRLDFEDFVFLSGEEDALQISKQDITSMMNFFKNQGAQQTVKPEDDISYQKTGESRTIKGYQTEQFIFTENDEPNSRVVAWMTRQIDINWGMLAEPWGDPNMNMLGDKIPIEIIFEEGYFPLLVEAYENGKLTEVSEASEVSKSDIARAMVQIPPGVKVLSFQDYLFNKMGEQ